MKKLPAILLKKSHTCEEGGAHLSFSFLAYIDELEKQLLKKLLKWANKKQITSIFTMLNFLKKKTEKLL